MFIVCSFIVCIYKSSIKLFLKKNYKLGSDVLKSEKLVGTDDQPFIEWCLAKMLR